jgi:ATP-dependent Clp protease ATP-binding subunit ClpC
MFERFTDRARRVVVLAQEEARMLYHNYIGTEHILLGLIHEGEGVAARALVSLPDLAERCQQLTDETERLRALLRQHGINSQDRPA